MTLLLKSKSNLFNSRVIYISEDKLCVHHWQCGKLVSPYLFDVDSKGQANFKYYLEKSDNTPAYILVDIIEEEFRQDTIPHVFGSDKNALIKRKQNRLFRDLKYQYAEAQGREEAGRRDDKFMFMALTNNSILEPWLRLMDEHKVPVKGILSLPQLLQSYIQTLPDISDYALIVSMQSISGLRQTFFLRKQIKISRLSKLPRLGTGSYVPKIMEEIDRIQRYLNSLYLAPNDNGLDVYILADKSTLDEFDEKKTLLPNMNYHYLDVRELASVIHLRVETTIPFVDQLFLGYLLRTSLPNYYATSHNMRYAKMRKIRIAMNLCSLLLLLVSLVYSGYSMMDGLLLMRQKEDILAKADFYQARYDMAKKQLPKTPVDSYKIRATVEAVDRLYEYKASPYTMLSIIGQSMQDYPEIQPDNIDWTSSIEPRTEDSNVSNNKIHVVGPGNKERFKYFQTSIINARIYPFDGDYREAISIINKFAKTLREKSQVYVATIVSLPLDTSSTVSLQGSTDVIDKAASFSLKVIIGID